MSSHDNRIYLCDDHEELFERDAYWAVWDGKTMTSDNRKKAIFISKDKAEKIGPNTYEMTEAYATHKGLV